MSDLDRKEMMQSHCGAEKTLERPMGSKEINQAIPKEINPEYISFGRTVVEAEAPILWPPDRKG